MAGKPEETVHQDPASSSSPKVSAGSPAPSDDETKKWGTHIMGAPAYPTAHPDNQMAAAWSNPDRQQNYHYPYVQYSPVDRPTSNPLEPVIHLFNSWSSRAESISRNIWHNLKTGKSVSEAAWGKVNLTAKAITEGGFESLFRQTFGPDPSEKLKKTFACYLSTATGPVAGTLYLSTLRLAFCSDRPLYFTAPSGQTYWSYYKVTIRNKHIPLRILHSAMGDNSETPYSVVLPLGDTATVNPVVMKENPPEKYIQISTVDGHDFWFMGFVNFEKATHHLLNSVSDFRAQVVS